MRLLAKTAAIAAVAILAACSGSNGWKLKGSVEGAEKGEKLALEGFNGASWYHIDSLAVGDNGSFAYSAPQATSHPDIYRISRNGASIYFPVDSIETVTINANASNFASGYTLEGSDNAVAMMNVDRMIAESIAAVGIDSTLVNAPLKKTLNEILLADSTGLVAYYVINKTLGNKPLYNPNVRKDLNMIGAIANKFITYKPNDPRTQALKNRFIEARRASGSFIPSEIEVPTMGLIEIELPNPKGQKKSLQAVANENKVTLLCFTSFDVEASPAINIALNKVYEANRAKGLEIYQVSFDQDEVNWMQAAANLPWVAVRANETEGKILQLYNVAEIPTVFIIDNGEIAERIDDLDKLPAAVAKRL